MKKILFTLMIAALLLPPLSSAQDTQLQKPNVDNEEAQRLKRVKAEEERVSAIMALKPPAVRDKRDVDDWPIEKSILAKLGYSAKEAEKRLNEPRLVLAQKEFAIENEWMLTFTHEVGEKNFNEEVDRIVSAYGVKVIHEYKGSIFWMLSFTGDPSRAENLSKDLKVRRVHQSSRLKIEWGSKGPQEQAGIPHKNLTTRLSPDWGLDLLDTQGSVLDGYYNPHNEGAGTDVYVFDSGIIANATHFQSRVDPYFYNTGTGQDLDGHGTAMASLVGSSSIGAAASVDLKSVRLSNGSSGTGWISDTDIGIAIDNVRTAVNGNRPRFAVASMSFIFGPATPGTGLDQPLQNLIAVDVPVIVAVGQAGDTWPANASLDASNYWPQRVAGVMRAGIFDNDYEKTFQSSGLGCGGTALRQLNGVHIFTPGGFIWQGVNCVDYGITVLSNNGTTYKATGASVAAPLVAGAATHYGALQTTYVPREWMIREALSIASTKNYVSALGAGDLNQRLYTNHPKQRCFNAASYAEGIARDALAVCYGGYAAPQTGLTLKTTENGADLAATNVAGYAAQTNFLVPNVSATGPQLVKSTQTSGGPITAIGFAYVDTVNPGVFTLDSNGMGYAVAQAYFTDKTTSALTIVNNSPSGWNWNPATHYLTIVTYGTGWRHRLSLGAAQVRFFKNGSPVAGTPPSTGYAGLVNGVDGLDQINADNPNTFLPGQGEVEMRIFVDGKEANRTKVRFN